MNEAPDDPDNKKFLEKYAGLITQATQAWKALVSGREENISYAEYEARRSTYMDLMKDLKYHYAKDGYFMRDLRSGTCKDGINGNFHLITEVVTGQKSSPSRFR